MKKKFLSIKDGDKMFDRFLKKAQDFGVVPIPSIREERDQKMQGVVPPDSPRIAQLKGQTILEKEVDGYTLRVISTFDPLEKKFPKVGKFWVRLVAINAKGQERGVFTWKTTRTGEFLDRALVMIEFLSNALDRRPYDRKHQLMTLYNQVGKNKEQPFVWRGRRENGTLYIDMSFINGVPNHLKDAIREWRRKVWYYETVVREREGYKRRERDIRKPYQRGVRRKKKA